MKIVFFHNGPDLYGASRSLLRLTSQLISDGHHVSVGLPEEGPLSDRLTQGGVDVALLPSIAVMKRHELRKIGGVLRFLLGFPIAVGHSLRLIRKIRPDIVHTNTSVILAPPFAAALARVPHVWHVREFFADFPLAWKIYGRLIPGLADQIVCVSAAVAEQFPSRAREKINVIHNGFPREEFESVPEQTGAEFRERFRIPPGPVVGVVGSINIVRKGQEVFVRAAAQLKDRFPQATFLLVGGPHPGNEDHPAKVLKLAEELGIGDRVIYTGTLPDVSGAYQVLDISVLPSGRPEPFGGVVVESMAFALPVVGTRHGGTPEQIVDAVTGYLVDPGNVSQLADRIGRLLESPDLRRRFGTAGRRRFESEFEFAPFYRKLKQLYGELLP